MPGLPPSSTYVRTFSSGKWDTQGSGGVPRRRRPVTTKGVMESQALPSS